MKNLIDSLKEIFQRAAKKAFSLDEPIEITQSTKELFGHYQCNSPLKFASLLGKNPREIANELLLAVETSPLIEKMEVKGAGFINIFLSIPAISNDLIQVLDDPHLGVPLPTLKKRIICDFSSPNIAKAMHVGHLRSTIIGDSIARLQEFLGHDVKRLNHIGDWGTQFGMLITYLKLFQKGSIENAGVEDLMGWYKKSKEEFDNSPAFKKASQEEVVKLQNGDPESLKTWAEICTISKSSFEEIYKLLGVHIDERGESFYNPFLATVISDFEQKGLVTVDDGAKCVYLEGFTNKEGERLPLIIQKRDGGFNYATTDLAGFHYRVTHDKADRIIIVTDIGQATHFKMVYDAACLVGYIDPTKVTFNHVPFGLVLAPDGKKFKTRSGETERLSDLLEEAVAYAKELLKERDIEDLETSARILGIGSVKYADLSCNRIKDYTFSYERMLRFEGNTAAFILYAYVRIQSIKRKLSPKQREKIFLLEHPTEISLALHLRQFGEMIVQMDQDLLPNQLADYLYHLAEKFHAFFRDCRVEGTKEETSRLLLCEVTEKILKKGLFILGLDTIEKM